MTTRASNHRYPKLETRGSRWWLLRLSAKISALLRLSVTVNKKVKNLFLLFQRVKYLYFF